MISKLRGVAVPITNLAPPPALCVHINTGRAPRLLSSQRSEESIGMNFWFIKYCDFQKKSRSVLLPGALAVHQCRVLIAVEEMFPGRGRQLKLKVINHILILLLKTTNKTGRVLSCSENQKVFVDRTRTTLWVLLCPLPPCSRAGRAACSAVSS